MVPAKTFSLSSLKVGEEVDVVTGRPGEESRFTHRVAGFDELGCILVEGQELPFWPDDGREMELIINGEIAPCPNGTRVCAPTDEGRRRSLADALEFKIEELTGRMFALPLEDLRRLEATIEGLLIEYPEQVVIDVSSVDDASHILKFVHGG